MDLSVVPAKIMTPLLGSSKNIISLLRKTKIKNIFSHRLIILSFVMLLSSGQGLFLTGCGPKISAPNMQATPEIETDCNANGILSTACELKGIPYKYGGNTPKTGFDCSGFVRYVMAEHGMEMPRRAIEQMNLGTKTDWEDLQPGDLVFFKIKRGKRRIMHVGIYSGNGRMIHSPRRGKTVSEEDISIPYWQKSFIGARRITELTKE